MNSTLNTMAATALAFGLIILWIKLEPVSFCCVAYFVIAGFLSAGRGYYL